MSSHHPSKGSSSKGRHHHHHKEFKIRPVGMGGYFVTHYFHYPGSSKVGNQSSLTTATPSPVNSSNGSNSDVTKAEIEKVISSKLNEYISTLKGAPGIATVPEGLLTEPLGPRAEPLITTGSEPVKELLISVSGGDLPLNDTASTITSFTDGSSISCSPSSSSRSLLKEEESPTKRLATIKANESDLIKELISRTVEEKLRERQLQQESTDSLERERQEELKILITSEVEKKFELITSISTSWLEDTSQLIDKNSRITELTVSKLEDKLTRSIAELHIAHNKSGQAISELESRVAGISGSRKIDTPSLVSCAPGHSRGELSLSSSDGVTGVTGTGGERPTDKNRLFVSPPGSRSISPPVLSLGPSSVEIEERLAALIAKLKDDWTLENEQRRLVELERRAVEMERWEVEKKAEQERQLREKVAHLEESKNLSDMMALFLEKVEKCKSELIAAPIPPTPSPPSSPFSPALFGGEKAAKAEIDRGMIEEVTSLMIKQAMDRKTNETDINFKTALSSTVASMASCFSTENLIGEIRFYLGYNDPNGEWMVTNGRGLSKAEYSGLYSFIIINKVKTQQTETTFTIPNLKSFHTKNINGMFYVTEGSNTSGSTFFNFIIRVKSNSVSSVVVGAV